MPCRTEHKREEKAAIEMRKYEKPLDVFPTLSACQWDFIDIQRRVPLLAAHIKRQCYDQ